MSCGWLARVVRVELEDETQTPIPYFIKSRVTEH